MRILVCFKISCDMEAVSDGEWKLMTEQGVDLTYIRKVIGCFDEAALELGLRLADQIRESEDVELTALTVGEELDRHFEKNLYAVKYDRVCLIQTEEELHFSPLRTAELIKEFMEEEPDYDIVIMGQRSAEGNHGQTHIMLSELENMPAYTHVRDVRYQDGYFLLDNYDERYQYTHKIKKRFIAAVEHAAHPYLRVATLREKMQVSGKSAQCISAKSGKNCLGAVRFEKDMRNRTCHMIEGTDAKEKAETFYQEYLRQFLKDGDDPV